MVHRHAPLNLSSPALLTARVGSFQVGSKQKHVRENKGTRQQTSNPALAVPLREGDMIAFEVEADHLVVHKVTPGRDDYLKGLSEVLSEWVSPEDEEAWRDL